MVRASVKALVAVPDAKKMGPVLNRKVFIRVRFPIRVEVRVFFLVVVWLARGQLPYRGRFEQLLKLELGKAYVSLLAGIGHAMDAAYAHYFWFQAHNT